MRKKKRKEKHGKFFTQKTAWHRCDTDRTLLRLHLNSLDFFHEVKEDFRSQNEFVIAAINDYYARHLALKRDPYLESREKEDAFVKGIVEAVEQKVLDNLPGLAGMYMMQQQSLLSVLGLQGMVPVQQQAPMPQMVAGMQMSGQVSAAVQESKQGQETMVGGDGCEKRDYTEEDEKKYQIEPDINEFLDFSFCGE